VQIDDEVARIPQQEGEATTQHVETMFPSWSRQKESLKLLNDERRTRHREMANEGRKKRTFQPGDLVLVRKQVKSNGAEGKPAKLTLKARGPCRMLEEAGENACWMQKIPAVQSLTKRPGKRMKELAVRMKRLLSSMVIHKRVAALDNRLAEMEGALVSNPLERNLGFYDFRSCTKAPGYADFAFEKINELWNEETHADLNSDDEAEDSTDDSDSELEQATASTGEKKRSTKERRELKQNQNTSSHHNNNNNNRDLFYVIALSPHQLPGKVDPRRWHCKLRRYNCSTMCN
jgi:hypothetical protein